MRFSRTSFLLVISFFLYAYIATFPFVREFDHKLLVFFHSVEMPVFEKFLLYLLAIGSIPFSVTILFLISAWLFIKNEPRKAYLVLAALLFLTALEFLMKHVWFHPRVPMEYRDRIPEEVGPFKIKTPYSFPSGHSLRTMFLLGVSLLWTRLSQIKPAVIVFTLVILPLQIIGMNHFGFHWTSDVIGGYWLSFVVLYLITQIEKI